MGSSGAKTKRGSGAKDVHEWGRSYDYTREQEAELVQVGTEEVEWRTKLIGAESAEVVHDSSQRSPRRELKACINAEIDNDDVKQACLTTWLQQK